MSLNLDICEFIKSSIQFLGHIISSSGIQPDPTKITSITNFPIPRNLKGLRAFLGLTGYYRRFTPLYAKRTQPLLELTKKGRKWKWEKKHQEAFDQVKTLFVENIMLHHPQREGKFVIYSDVSDYAVGSVLYQKDSEGKLLSLIHIFQDCEGLFWRDVQYEG